MEAHDGDIIYCKNLYQPIVEEKLPTCVTEEEWRVLNQKAVGMIRLYINHNIFHHVANDTNAYEMWQKLESMYERKKAMNKASVIKWLAKLEYRDGSSVTEHLNVFQCPNQVSAMKINFIGLLSSPSLGCRSRSVFRPIVEIHILDPVTIHDFCPRRASR
jgi:hypothetical protein